ncbi:MAG: hypothetical protein HZA30_05420 [Candidatus Omnitrophica bacterium]|nr:hypothetical protein [Candidatus Omnitrophota bacterium]
MASLSLQEVNNETGYQAITHKTKTLPVVWGIIQSRSQDQRPPAVLFKTGMPDKAPKD